MQAIKPKIAILGAGLLGRMLTVSLMNDFDITLYDKDDGDAQQSAGFLAAAMLAPLAESADCSIEIMQMGEQALSLWPEFLDNLEMNVYFQQTGSLMVAFEQDLAALKQFKSRLKGRAFQEMDSQQIHALEPELNTSFSKGLFLPNEAQLDNRQLLEALGSEIKKHDINKNNVVWQYNANVEVNEEVVLVNQKPLSDFDWVIDCRGVGLQKDLANSDSSKELLDGVSPFRAVRGEVIRVHAPEVNLTRPVRLMHPRYPIYIAPKENHNFVIGATQIESEDKRNPTVRSVLELLSACFSVHRGFAEAEVMSIDSGLRPAFLDNHPKIIQHKNRLTVNGLFRHGYLLAPVVVKACLEVINCNNNKLKPNTESISNLPGLVVNGNIYKKATAVNVEMVS
ncbi:FAD-dependent oxidoreductase [Thiomicrorhabdus sp. Milos-T2]|uniref:FAD-dependent oxidoreductase n=1 Tax=Thiomicrorhabdus sp. Milos-T2 TaxID=90814 RepID=UPI00068C2290|nr:FAD-dependent oxidoreductase [Thiomicrorhabdus sp. Milos-T2]